MKTPETIKKVLRECDEGYACKRIECPYDDGKCLCNGSRCMLDTRKDALTYIVQLEAREWELFDLLSSAWYGKQNYFKQDDGTVYSRQSCKYLTFDQAIDEFANAITVAGDMDKRMEDDLE